MYCRKMLAYTDNDKLLIYCFQDSLIKVAAQWYLKLDRTHIRSWKDLARAFLTQLKHATDFTPDRLAFQTMEKRYNESFRDYVQRWRTMAAQVQSVLVETKITILFLGILQEPYYDRLMYTATESFANIIKAGNVIDHAIKNGKIDLRKSSSKPKRGSFPKKKEGETQALYQQNPPNQSRRYVSYQNHSNYQPYYSASSNQASTMAPHFTSPNNQTPTIQARQPVPNSQPSSSRNNYLVNNQANNNP